MHSSLVEESLAICAERLGDISDPVYEKFFAGSGEAAGLMAHSDEGMRGRMMAQTLELLLTDEHLGEGGYLRWEVNNHLLAYGVDVGMYQGFLQAVLDVVQESLGEDWHADYAQAWRAKIDALLADIFAEANA